MAQDIFQVTTLSLTTTLTKFDCTISPKINCFVWSTSIQLLVLLLSFSSVALKSFTKAAFNKGILRKILQCIQYFLYNTKIQIYKFHVGYELYNFRYHSYLKVVVLPKATGNFLIWYVASSNLMKSWQYSPKSCTNKRLKFVEFWFEVKCFLKPFMLWTVSWYLWRIFKDISLVPYYKYIMIKITTYI